MLRRTLARHLRVTLVTYNRRIGRAIGDVLSLTTGRVSVDRNRLHFRVIKHENYNNARLTRVHKAKANRRGHLNVFTNNRYVEQVKFRGAYVFDNNANMITFLNWTVDLDILKERLLHVDADHANAHNDVKVEVTKVQHDTISTKLNDNLGGLKGRFINRLLRLVVAQRAL